jgi:hypothetical protein
MHKLTLSTGYFENLAAFGVSKKTRQSSVSQSIEVSAASDCLPFPGCKSLSYQLVDHPYT